MLAALATREAVPAPPSKEALAPNSAPPTTAFQIAKALVEETKRSAWDTYLRAYSLAFQLAGYLTKRAVEGENAYAFGQWEVMYTADFVDALNRGWPFKDLKDAIDLAQITKFRFICCTPRRLFDNGEPLMKQVSIMRRKGMTTRQKLGEGYPSWYLDNAGSLETEGEKENFDSEVDLMRLRQEQELQREHELDADIPILTLSTTGKVNCINPDCPYRFDSRELMYRHFDACFAKAAEETPIDAQDALDEELADAFDDECGVLPCAVYPCLDEDQAEGRWERYAPHNAGGGMMFNPWAADEV